MKNKRFIIILCVIVILLLIPLVAMQFTREVNWTLSDFIVATILLLGSGILFELIIRNISNINYRILFCLVLFIILILLWIELAVGIFGSPISGN